MCELKKENTEVKRILLKQIAELKRMQKKDHGSDTKIYNGA